MILDTIICNLDFLTNCYIFGDEKTKEVVIIDPGGEPLAIARRIRNRGYKPIAVILTHGHADHTAGLRKLTEFFDVPVLYHPLEHPMINYPGAQFIEEPKVIEIGEEKLEVINAPGHTAGGIMLVSYSNRLIFTGDTIMRFGVGRTDLGGNDEDLWNTLRHKIFGNPAITDDFLILPGHNEESTVGEERKYNMFRRYFL